MRAAKKVFAQPVTLSTLYTLPTRVPAVCNRSGCAFMFNAFPLGV